MAHFLIADDRERVRAQFALWLKQKNHTFQEAVDISDVLEKVEISEKEQPFDLILLDHDFGGGEYGYMALEKLEPSYREHRVVVITAHPDEEIVEKYTALGSINHLLKDVKPEQFNVTLRSALKCRELFLLKQDWEQAIEVLDRSGMLDGFEKLNKDYAELALQLDNLRAINEQLQEELRNAGEQEAKKLEAYARASESLKKIPGEYEDIYPLLQGYDVAEAFLGDVKRIFSSNRQMYYALTATLKKIQDNPNYPITQIVNSNQKHYEYRVHRDYRLYVLKQERVTLCRFTKKEYQNQTIEHLRTCDLKLAFPN